jgi:hypothetical protein
VKTLSLTEASRSFSDCVQRVYSRKESFAIVRLGVPCALLVPAPEGGCTSHELADDLAKACVNVEDRRAFSAALRKGRKSLKPLRNPWG